MTLGCSSDALGVKRAAVAGHSLGSMVAISLAADHPDRVSKLILIGSTALVPVKRGDWLYDNVAAMKGPLDPATQFARDWHPANQPTPVDPAFAEAMNADLYRIPGHVWQGVMREMSYVPVGRHAADVKAPVLVLSGGKDPLFPRRAPPVAAEGLPAGEGSGLPRTRPQSQLGAPRPGRRRGPDLSRLMPFVSQPFRNRCYCAHLKEDRPCALPS